MLKSKQLIKKVRERSNNLDWGPNSGISDETIIGYLNDAKTDIHSAIINEHPNTFNKEVIIDLVEGQEAYELPSDLNEAGGVVRVERKLFGTDRWCPLSQGGPIDRSGGYRGLPRIYIRQNNTLLLRPIPSLNGPTSLRIVYKADFNNLGIDYFEITGEDLDSSNGTINSLTIDIADSSSSDIDVLDKWEISQEALEGTDYISVIDSKGNLIVRNFEVDSTDWDTGVISAISGSYDPVAHPSLIGMRVVVGFNASTKIIEPLPPSRLIQTYLVDYAVKEVIASDSSVDVQEKILKLQATEKRIVESYAQFDEDFYNIQDLQGIY